MPRTDELDSVGPVAQAVLRRHGPLWPFNAHFHMPLLERASGGERQPEAVTRRDGEAGVVEGERDRLGQAVREDGGRFVGGRGHHRERICS